MTTCGKGDQGEPVAKTGPFIGAIKFNRKAFPDFILFVLNGIDLNI
jgi:hypothetical protein